MQLEKYEATTKDYKKEVEGLLAQKEEVIKEMRADLERKQREVDRWQ